MTSRLPGCLLAVASLSIGACAHAPSRSAVRLDAIHRAQVWTATDVAAMDIMVGPKGPGAFARDATVHCTYVDKKMTGRSPKFTCAITPDDEVKVKFGPDNGEVFAEVAASRLLWALGFGADRMYPVRVVCKGCPPWIVGSNVAAIERKMTGAAIESDIESGWAWRELDLVDPALGGASRAERDALTLLAVFMQHTDSKADQQRLVCLSTGKALPAGTPCGETFMLVQDIGLTFGHATRLNGTGEESTNLKAWAQAPIWKDPARCVANLRKSMTGTLKNPTIGEDGRRFLAGLLARLSDSQIRDLFDVARFKDRVAAPDQPAVETTTQQWVDAFKRKRLEIVDHTCPG